MKLLAVVVLCVIVLIGDRSGASGDVPLTERYAAQWVSSFNVAISRALAKNNVRGCGEYKFKASQKNSGEYLVRCTSDGVNWQTYIVWPKIDKVMGPYVPDPSMD